ncbi:CamS family sex pheromone protein [Bombilactobacillus thymidiniphilus]|uniref:CamS family sex pheromone protein n=1 Tax=Bombilactobacillus thymidiniphilus TaxID=2923363 RepID=A0ABY4PC55_9LACO|nr:CamS family sex pheromone protein [Bombilactobacillus thymidiniphilus]UQS83234.1 CamS family sex pheromone protein [Bombilactobacillus thymidiniphilus]
MKNFYKVGLMLTVSALLAGCGNLTNSSLSSHSNGTKTSKVTTTGTSKSGQYSTLLQGGEYHTSAITGLNSESDSDNASNPKSFEAGLLEISKKEFSPDKYFFQEGKMISASQAQKWLGRKSKNNPEGLNPEDNGSTDADKRNPIYLQQLLEQDFYTQNDKNYDLSGMTIGLSMNDVDYYTKEKYGAKFETKISDEQRLSEGREMANEIVNRLRRRSNLKNITITVGLYKQNVNDSLVGGTFFNYGVSSPGQKKVTNWKNISQQNQVLPVVNDEKPINSNDSEDFSNFKNHIQSYFSNLSGVTAQTHYQDGKLKGMAINITTQFYGVAQIDSFTQFVQDAAGKYLPQQPTIEIKIQTVQDPEAILVKDYNTKQYSSHVFASY